MVMVENETTSTVTLRDGNQVTIRPIQPADAPLLQDLLTRLSPESVYKRFMAYLKRLSDEQAERFANVNYDTEMAFVATNAAGQVIGVARYMTPNPPEPGAAEAAVVVEDAYQGNYLGTYLLRHLVQYALVRGIGVFTAAIHPSNEKIVRFIRKSGYPVESRFSDGMIEFRVHINEEAVDPPDFLSS
jgi:RimJ/RimL family protein N-acetyltransferase